MTRILYVSHSFPLPGDPLSNVGGMQRVATELHRALAAHDEVELHSLVLETAWEETGRRMPGYYLRLLREIPSRVRRERIDVVLFSSMVTATVLLLLRERIAAAGALTAAIPVGRDVTLPNPVYQRIVPRVLAALDLVLPISRATAEECLARGAAPERVHVVPCGVEVERFPRVDDRTATRAALLRALSLPVDPGSLLLCSVGRHQERKGFHWFVEEVMPLLPADVVYLLAGDGPMTGRIRAAAAERGVADRVRLLGRVPEETLADLYRGADLFVMPNVPVPGDIEGFGVVMLEAGMGGLPVLAADLEGIRDVVREGRNGHLLPSLDAGAFARAIQGYRDDPARLAAASRAARDFVTGHFAWPSVADQHLAVFRSALDDRRRDPASPARLRRAG